MKELVYDIKEFDMEGFLKAYEKDFKYIYNSVDGEELKYLVDLFNVENLSVEPNINEDELIDILKNDKKGIFLLIGAVADENARYYRFIDGTQYRISLGEVYEYSAERFHDFKTKEDLIDRGNIEFDVEISLGLSINKNDNNIVINFSEIKNSEGSYYLEYIYNSGDLGKLIEKYLNRFKV